MSLEKDVHPAQGGCWFCHTEAQSGWLFSFEFDAHFHAWCARAEGVLDADDPVLAYEDRHYSAD